MGALRRVGGLRRLWLLCAPSRSLALLLVPSGALLGVFPVGSSAWRVVYYSLTFVGPSLLLASGSLTVANTSLRALAVQLIAAFSGSLIGLAVGFLL